MSGPPRRMNVGCGSFSADGWIHCERLRMLRCAHR
jgi:hypothetical protein